MVKYSQSSLDAVFHALADPGRRQMIEALSRGEQTVSELAAPLSISLPAVSKHLGVLERAGLLRRRREGRRHHLSAVPEALQNASDWIENHRRFWEGSFDKLDQHLASQPDNKTP